jgi:hypothetical protein
MPYSKDELKSELLRCYENEGEVTTELLNSSDTDYPTQMTYYNHFGSLKNAKESAGLIAGHTKSRVLSDIRKCYEENGAVSTELLNSSDDLVNYSVVYSHYGSLPKAVSAVGINWNDAKSNRKYNEVTYSEDELIENLIDCKESEGDTKTSTINSFDGPSSSVYQDRFGSIADARIEAGITESFKGGNNGKVKRLIKEVEIDKDADAHIYVLEIRVNEETAYYVGETKDIEKRIRSHLYRTRIQAWANGPYGKILAPRDKSNELNEIDIESIKYTIPMNKKEDESNIDFRRRRKYKEHHRHLALAMEKDTLEVYGGR